MITALAAAYVLSRFGDRQGLATQLKDANVFATWPRECGQEPPATRYTAQVQMASKSGSHTSHGSGRMRAKVQVCQYATLDAWHKLAGKEPWSLTGGSLLGLACYGGILPWDDDIDIYVKNCNFLAGMWASGLVPAMKYAWDSNWEVRALRPGILMYKHSNTWYKIKLVREFGLWDDRPPDLGGVDLFCPGTSLARLGEQAALFSTASTFVYPFGPTHARAVSSAGMHTLFRAMGWRRTHGGDTVADCGKQLETYR